MIELSYPHILATRKIRLASLVKLERGSGLTCHIFDSMNYIFREVVQISHLGISQRRIDYGTSNPSARTIQI
jgi:hypothetical protein